MRKRNKLWLACATLGMAMGVALPAARAAEEEKPAPPPAPGKARPPEPRDPPAEGSPRRGLPPGGARFEPGMMIDRLESAVKELDLSTEQTAKVDEAFAAARKSSDSPEGDPRERMRAMGKTLGDLKSSLDAILSDEQKQKLEEKAPMFGRMAEGPGGFGGRPGGPGGPPGSRPGGPPPGQGRPGEGRPGEGRPGEGRPGLDGRGGMMMNMVNAALEKVDLSAEQKEQVRKAIMEEAMKMRDQGPGGRPGGDRPGFDRPGGERPDRERGDGRPRGDSPAPKGETPDKPE